MMYMYKLEELSWLSGSNPFATADVPLGKALYPHCLCMCMLFLYMYQILYRDLGDGPQQVPSIL